MPDAPRSRDSGLIHPDRPVVGFRTASLRNVGKLHCFFSPLKHLSFVGGKSLPHNLLPPAYLYLIPYPLCTLSLSASLSTTSSPIPTHPRRLSRSLLAQSLSLSPVGCLPLSGKQLFLAAQPTPRLFTGSSSCSLTPPRLLLFILLPRSVPLSSPLIQAHSALFPLDSLPQLR